MPKDKELHKLIQALISTDIVAQAEASSKLSKLTIDHIRPFLSKPSETRIKQQLFRIATCLNPTKALELSKNNRSNFIEVLSTLADWPEAASNKHPGEITQDAMALVLESLTEATRGTENPDTLLIGVHFLALARHKQYAPWQPALRTLEYIAAHHKAPIRSSAIGLLGFYGEIDIIERVSMFPIVNTQDRNAMQHMIHQITSRPINLLALRPVHFEHLIQRLLQRMGYKDVIVTPPTWDEGVDVQAKKPFSTDTVIVQCKRLSSKITKKTLRELEQAQREQNATEALLVTTSSLSNSAQKHLNNRIKDGIPLRFIGGEDLKKLLTKHFPGAKYDARTSLRSRSDLFNTDLLDWAQER